MIEMRYLCSKPCSKVKKTTSTQVIFQIYFRLNFQERVKQAWISTVAYSKTGIWSERQDYFNKIL